MTEIKAIAKDLLSMTDSIIKTRVKNSVILGIYNRLVLPYLSKQIDLTPDNEIAKHLQFAYKRLQPMFEKKHLKDQIDEADKLSGNKIASTLLKDQSKYF